MDPEHVYSIVLYLARLSRSIVHGGIVRMELYPTRLPPNGPSLAPPPQTPTRIMDPTDVVGLKLASMQLMTNSGFN